MTQRLGMDPVEFRCRSLLAEGDEGPTGQVMQAVGALECLERAATLAGWGAELPRGEGMGVSCGWWFSMPSPSGAYVKLNADGTVAVPAGRRRGALVMPGRAARSVCRASARRLPG